MGTASFDLAGSGVAATRYLRIVDQSAGDPDAAFAGLELDAVTVLNGTGPTSLAVDACGRAFVGGCGSVWSRRSDTSC